MTATPKIRLATITDAEQIQAIYEPIVRDTYISFEEIIPDAEEIQRRITAYLQQYPYLVCDIDGQIAGYCYGSVFRTRTAYQWTTETTVYVHPDFHRRGIARALYTALINILRGQGYMNALAGVALPNDASVKCHESVGFEKVGVYANAGFKANGWHDVGWWQLELNPMPPKPTPPTPIGDYSQTANFNMYLTEAEKLIRP